MKYHLILINTEGYMTEHTLELPVTPEISWPDFEQLSQVKDLLLQNPSMRLHDVTPDGMPSWFTDEEWMTIQQNHMGSSKLTVPDDL